MLASRSPQRRAILTQLGVRFRVEVPDVQELDRGDAAELAVANARCKAGAVEGRMVLGVDTTVVLDGRVFGKPRDRAHAGQALGALAGRTHAVVSGICLRAGAEERCASATTAVRFRELSTEEIDWYLDTGEWRERAGGYAIQGRGAVLVVSIDGDFWNVVGLPVAALTALAPELVMDGGGVATAEAGPDPGGG